MRTRIGTGSACNANSGHGGMDMEEWREGLRFISWANRLAYLCGRLSIGTIRADVACVARHSGQYIRGVSYRPVYQALSRPGPDQSDSR